MNQTLNSRISRAGDRFQATVVTPVYASGVEVVPQARSSKARDHSLSGSHSRREGQLAVQFDSVIVPDGTRHQLDGALTELQDARAGKIDAESEVSGNSSDKRNVAYVAAEPSEARYSAARSAEGKALASEQSSGPEPE